MNSKSSSSTSTIIEYSRIFNMNSDKSWIMNYGSSLREKEENFDNLCCESPQPTVEITSMAHKIRTTLTRRWIFKRASGIRCLHDGCKTRPPLKAAAAASSNPVSIHRGQSPTQEKKSAFERTEFGLWFLDDRRGGDIFETLIFKYAYFDTMDRRHREEASAKLIGKIIHVWGLVALPSPPKL